MTPSAGFDTLSGVNITDNETADSGDNELEIVAAAHLANSYIMDGLAGDDTVYFSEAGATYHLDPTWVNGFEDVSGFETLELLSDVHLEINGGVLDSESTGDIEHLKGSGDNRVTIVNNHADFGLDVTITDIDIIDMNNYDLTLDKSDLSQINTIEGDTQSTLVFTGQFTYDFAEGLIMTKDVTRLGLDAGNYDYSLTLDGVNDEDVREIYAYGANEIEGNVMIDARANAKITLIDLAGDEFTTGGIDGDSNIFVTYDDALEVLGGDNDDDLDVILESDIEDGEFQFDGGGDNEDTLNINLNGDEIDTLALGVRSTTSNTSTSTHRTATAKPTCSLAVTARIPTCRTSSVRRCFRREGRFLGVLDGDRSEVVFDGRSASARPSYIVGRWRSCRRFCRR